ncbi:Histidine kinase-, DNA gyrase B-, and HSP90-like ATPase [Thermomonospora echinospora]|uniref:Histidine kinase-, DNA gyrase B-, and HSP90-like ATPase n=1 Tax=Thermomonospora echinospora TaxID=1992 RepID=A0A1H6BRK4_9ACTN|nr:histidine kinase [Thermomonospora echinospora]SEG62856.1 Histidine kinase-, DNA gyrase B-, and HSP90-like ATPase [Thermomonospora echinospora]
MRVVVTLVRLVAATTPVLIGCSYALRLGAPGPLWGPGAVVGSVFPAVGAFLLTYRPRLWAGWLIWGGGTVIAGYEVLRQIAYWLHAGGHEQAAATVGWSYAWLGQFGLYQLLGVLFLYPDGHLPSPRWRPLLVAAAWLPVLPALYVAFDPGPVGPGAAPNPYAWDALEPLSGIADPLRRLGWLIPVGCGAVALFLRYRRGSRDLRRQILWAAYPGSLLVTTELLVPDTPPFRAFQAVVLLALPVAVAVGLLRYRLGDIDLIINRTLVYGLLVAVIGAVYFGLTGITGMMWADGAEEARVAALVWAFTAGALFHPLRVRLQRGVDRLLRVERDPYLLADRLSRTVQEAPGPAEALRTAVATVRETLRVPGAAVEVVRGPGEPKVYRAGELGEHPHSVPLVWHGEPVGRMLVARPDTLRHRIDARLLGTLAVHLADVAHAVRLTDDLQRSRERILATREEERRRLRRDLHDGLGPTLASLAMSLDAARLTLARDPGKVEPLLAELRDRLATSIGDIRDLVYGLRPPALDDLGLEAAIKSLADRCAGRVDVRFDGDPDGLPAAVEVAAYRIVQEALTNIARHSRASTALVLLHRTDELHITVADSGVGLPATLRAGVGLNSMRERAAELGGSFTIMPRGGGGTLVTARLPLTVPAGRPEDPPPAHDAPGGTNETKVSMT